MLFPSYKVRRSLRAGRTRSVLLGIDFLQHFDRSDSNSSLVSGREKYRNWSTMTYLTDSPPLPPLSALFPNIRTDGTSLPRSADPFTVTAAAGFLPCRQPLARLPAEFDFLYGILDDMPIVKADGSAGLVANFQLGPLIDSGALPDLSVHVHGLRTESGDIDLDAITALFRDYSFLASAYLLEPCWESWSKDHDAGYGLGRAVLPACIASPLVKAADM